MGDRIKYPRRLGKQTIARQQLEDSIELFLEHRFVSSLTLAGAAEELLKQLLHSRGLLSTADDEVAMGHYMRLLAGKPSVTDSYLYSSIYEGRNHAKHHTPKKPEVNAFSPFSEAFMMLQRAMFDAKRLGLRISNGARYQSWYEQTIMSQLKVQPEVSASVRSSD